MSDLQGMCEARAQERLDVRFDTALVHGKRRLLDRPIASTEDAANFSLLKIPAAEIRNYD